MIKFLTDKHVFLLLLRLWLFGRFPLERAATIALSACTEFVHKNNSDDNKGAVNNIIENIAFVLFDDKVYEAWSNEAKKRSDILEAIG